MLEDDTGTLLAETLCKQGDFGEAVGGYHRLGSPHRGHQHVAPVAGHGVDDDAHLVGLAAPAAALGELPRRPASRGCARASTRGRRRRAPAPRRSRPSTCASAVAPASRAAAITSAAAAAASKRVVHGRVAGQVERALEPLPAAASVCSRRATSRSPRASARDPLRLRAAAERLARSQPPTACGTGCAGSGCRWSAAGARGRGRRARTRRTPAAPPATSAARWRRRAPSSRPRGSGTPAAAPRTAAGAGRRAARGSGRSGSPRPPARRRTGRGAARCRPGARRCRARPR